MCHIGNYRDTVRIQYIIMNFEINMYMVKRDHRSCPKVYLSSSKMKSASGSCGLLHAIAPKMASGSSSSLRPSITNPICMSMDPALAVM